MGDPVEDIKPLPITFTYHLDNSVQGSEEDLDGLPALVGLTRPASGRRYRCISTRGKLIYSEKKPLTVTLGVPPYLQILRGPGTLMQG